MTTLLGKALEKVGALPQDEQMPLHRRSLILSPMKRLGRSASPPNEIDCANWPRKLSTKTTGARPVLSATCFDRVEDNLTILGSLRRSVRRSPAGGQRLMTTRRYGSSLPFSRATPTMRNSRSAEPVFSNELTSASSTGTASPFAIGAVSSLICTDPEPFMT